MDLVDADRVGQELVAAAERSPHEHLDAVAYILPDGINRDKRPAELLKRIIDGRGDVLQGVHEGAVEVEDDEVDRFHEKFYTLFAVILNGAKRSEESGIGMNIQIL